MNPKKANRILGPKLCLKKHLRHTPMSAVVPPHVDVAVRRPANVAGKVVAKRRKGLPTILTGGLLTGWSV
jgi:hypothetical protein